MFLKIKLIFPKVAWLVHIVVPIFFIAIMFLLHPFRETFQFDTDEGLNLIKAVLVLEGHQSTRDIQTDQPPLMINILAFIFRLTGQSVNVSRMVILLFSALLLGAAGMASQIAWDRTTSILVYLILILIPNFLKFSVSVMIGQPSIALAMGALLCLFLWHRNRKWSFLVLTGLFMSLSLFIKFFTGFLIPIIGIGLLVSEWVILSGGFKKLPQGNWVQLLKPAFMFSVSLIIISVLLAISMLDLKNIMALVVPHIDARTTMKIGSINFYLKPVAIVIMLGVFGLGYSIAKRKWLVLYPFAWAIVAYILLLGHNPVWYHHQMLITIPTAMLAAFGVKSIIQVFWERDKPFSLWNKILILSGLIIIGAFLNQYIPSVVDQLGNRTPSIRSLGLDPESGDMRILYKMTKLADEGAVIVTDMPIFAVRAKMLVPLELAWISEKRFRTNKLTEQDVIDVIQREKPPLVLIARFPFETVRAFMDGNANYEELITTKIHTQKRGTLYHRLVP
jgi:hypothetical protein